MLARSGPRRLRPETSGPARGTRAVWLVPVAAAGLGELAWAGLADLAGPGLAAHAGLMLAAWGVLLPAGAVVARYGKVTRRQDFPHQLDNPWWWDWHRGLQYGGLALATLGLALVLSQTGGHFDTAHGRLGIAVLALGWGQVLAGLLRGTKGGPTDARADPGDPATWRGDHYDMTARRRMFESWHKGAGWVALAAGALTILLGLELAAAPAWLMALGGAAQGAVVAALLEGAARGRWVDNYAAHWGPANEVVPRARTHDIDDRRDRHRDAAE